MYPPVTQLPIHLENEQTLVYENNTDSAIKAVTDNKATPMTGYFDVNKHNKEANEYKYEDIPRHFTWHVDKQELSWQPRQIKSRFQIGRLVSIHPTQGDKYYLRLILKHRKGVESFKALRTVDGNEYLTFKAACMAMNLLRNDSQWIDCMKEATEFKVSYAPRDLFCSILHDCEPSDPQNLFEQFKDVMSDDFVRAQANTINLIGDEKEEYAHNELLIALNNTLVQFDQNNSNFNIPMPNEFLRAEAIVSSADHDPNASAFFIQNHELMNQDRQVIFDQIQHSYEDSQVDLIHIDAPAGCGKTFLANIILAYIRKQHRIAISTAMTGIAAILLTLGATTHRRFGFPIPIHHDSTSTLSLNCRVAKILKEAVLIMIDEISAMDFRLLDCLDRFMKALTNSDQHMGGKIIVVIGDFRQALPVVPGGTRAQTVASIVKTSCIWPFHLHENMRVHKLVEATDNPKRIQQLEDYASWLLQVGNGTLPSVHGNIIEVPPQTVCNDAKELEDKVYNDFLDNYDDIEYFREQAILSPLNDTIQECNFKMVECLPGELFVSESIDECIEDDDKKLYYSDFLNKINASGIPPHRLALKKNACIILIHNLNIQRGYCNGSRCLIECINKNVIKANNLNGGPNSTLFIPRMPIECKETTFPANFTRFQYPILGAYYLTFNRAQGQTLNKTGMFLPRSVFTHGLLYIGFSRCSDPNKVFMFADQKEFAHLIKQGILDPAKIYTRNIVYPEALT